MCTLTDLKRRLMELGSITLQHSMFGEWLSINHRLPRDSCRLMFCIYRRQPWYYISLGNIPDVFIVSVPRARVHYVALGTNGEVISPRYRISYSQQMQYLNCSAFILGDLQRGIGCHLNDLVVSCG